MVSDQIQQSHAAALTSCQILKQKKKKKWWPTGSSLMQQRSQVAKYYK
jgi:hypothetical protein